MLRWSRYSLHMLRLRGAGASAALPPLPLRRRTLKTPWWAPEHCSPSDLGSAGGTLGPLVPLVVMCSFQAAL